MDPETKDYILYEMRNVFLEDFKQSIVEGQERSMFILVLKLKETSDEELFTYSIPMNISNDQDKDIFNADIKIIIKGIEEINCLNCDVLAIISNQLSWASFFDTTKYSQDEIENMMEKMRPTEDPCRKELIISSIEFKGDIRNKLIEIVRRDGDSPNFVEAVDDSTSLSPTFFQGFL